MSNKPVYKPLSVEDMNSVAGFLLSLHNDTLSLMMQDIKEMLENPKCPEFQAQILAEWGSYVAQEVLARSGLSEEELLKLKEKIGATCTCHECEGCTEDCDEEPDEDSILTDEGTVLSKDKLN